MSSVPRFELSPGYDISRVIKGGWQLAGGHGRVDSKTALDDMRRYVEAGITTFDCADIYTGVEELIGAFLRCHRDAFLSGALPEVQVHTKYVPDLASLSTLTTEDVTATIERSLQRLGVERLDLVQFHWWDCDTPGYVDAAIQLGRLQETGKIRHVGVTNFDVPHLQALLDVGVPVVSNQIQYSVLDHRAERGMVDLCKERDMVLLCYGTVAGGFLSDRYLDTPEPMPPLQNRSLTKYKLIIDDLGDWEHFQTLLTVLQQIADKHGVSLARVATRYVLQKPRVAAAIVGARHARHLPDTLGLFDFALDEENLGVIRQVIGDAPGPEGSIYAVERAQGGKHASIMHYDLNATTQAAGRTSVE